MPDFFGSSLDDIFYGRRRGRSVRETKRTLLSDLLPRLSVTLPPEEEMLDPQKLFSHPYEEIWVEFGFGGGEHLATLVHRHPDIGFIGCEAFVNGVGSLLAKVVGPKGLGSPHVQKGETLIDIYPVLPSPSSDPLAPLSFPQNLRIYPHDGRPLLRALKEESIHKLFILFPDPWPKRRHQKRRLIQPKHVQQMAHILKPGGEVCLASDDPHYIQQMIQCFSQHPAFNVPFTKSLSEWSFRPETWPSTRYEQKALSLGKTCFYLTFFRKGERS